MAGKILFIGRRDDRPAYDTATSMVKRMNKIGKDYYASCDLEDLLFSFDGQKLRIINTKDGQDISTARGIFLIGWFKNRDLEDAALCVATYAKASNVPLLNKEAAYTRFRSKISQYVLSALNGVNTIPFIFSLDYQNKDEYLKQWTDYPAIVKSVTASRGRDNYLISSQSELDDILGKADDKLFVIQRFIPNDGDYRILVMGDEALLAIERKSQNGSHINNTSQGGAAAIAELSNLPPEMLEQSVKLAKIIRREVTGVDMVVDKQTGQFYLLEINNMPQLSTGSFVDFKMKALDKFLIAQFGI